MQFINSYLSDCSSDEENDTKTTEDKPNSSEDFFNLNDDETDEESTPFAPEELDVRVYTDTFYLANAEYGPVKETENNYAKQKCVKLQRFSPKATSTSVTNVQCESHSFRTQTNVFKKLKTNCDNTLVLETLVPQFDPATHKFNGKCRIPNRRTAELKNHVASVSSLEWYGVNLLLSASLDGTVRVWDASLRKCLHLIQKQRAGVKRAMWFHGSSRVLSGGFDKVVRLTDITSGKNEFAREHDSYVTSLQINKADKQTLLTGCKDCVVLWDLRLPDPVHKYRSSCGQVLDILMLPDNQEFVCSTEQVSRESSNRTLLAFDLRSTAILSNQIYNEHYTCPCLRLGATPGEFLAQSNAGYIAIFSTRCPYKLNRFKRYEGHKVMGYSIGFDLSPDKRWIVTGDAEGLLYYYNTWTAESQTVGCSEHPTVSIAWNPYLESTVAVGTWNGEIQLWR